MGTKYKDKNGFLHLEGVPISRVQVAPYLGKQIDAKGEIGLEPNKIYYVYRSPEELFDPKTMKSLEGMPFRVGHQMLGKGGGNVKTVDSTPIDGCFFNVRRGTEEDNVKKGDPKEFLFADIVIYTDRALKAIANGTKELSLGYRCAYVPDDGVHDGERYQFCQTNITANHLALVPHGRAGSSVCVQDEAIVTDDGLVVTCDSLPEEIQIMEENEKKAKDKLKELLKGSEENVQDCLDYCDLTEEQKKAVKAMKASKKPEEVPAEDKACKGCGKDELPAPVPPPAEEEKKAEPAAEEKPAEKPAEAPVAEVKEEVKEEVKPAPEAAPAEDEACKGKACEDKNGDGKCNDCGKPMFTQDELDAACAKAAKSARKDARRAKLLAEAVGEDASDEDTEAAVARRACKKIKGLEQYAQDSVPDGEVLAAVRGHLAHQVAEEDKPADKPEEKKPEDDKPVEAKPAEDCKPKAPKKKILTVAQDAAIAKTPHFSAADLTQYLGAH